MFGSGGLADILSMALAAALITEASESVTDAHLADRGDHVVDVLVAQLAREWERQSPVSDPLRVREIARFVAELLAVIVMQMDRGVVDTRAHVQPDQLVQHPVPALADRLGLQEDRIEMPPVDRSRLDGRRPHHRQGLERLVVARPNGLAPRRVTFEASELMDTERGLQIGHVVLEAGDADVVMLVALVGKTPPGVHAQPVECIHLDLLGELDVGGGDHAAFGSGDVLGRVEAEARQVPNGSDLAAVVRGFYGVRRIFDQQEAVPARELLDLVHAAGAASVVDRQDRTRARGNCGRDQRRIDVARVTLDVNEDRARARVDNGVGRRAERHRRGDHLVAGTNFGHEHREVQGGGAGAYRDGPSDPDVFPEEFLEASDSWPRAYPARPQGRDHLIDLLLLDQRTPEYEEILPHGAPSASAAAESRCERSAVSVASP